MAHLNQIPQLRKQNNPTRSFVWNYWHAGACGDELRWSMRSVAKYFAGDARLIVCGDRAPWHHGQVIVSPRVAHQMYRKWVDVVTKFQRIIDSPAVDETFAWMMDDQYFLKSFEFEELILPRADRRYQPAANASFGPWERMKYNTAQALRDGEFGQWDYATHAPHVFQKQKLQLLIDDFKLHARPLLVEMLYGNVYWPGPGGDLDGWLKITSTPSELNGELIWNHGHGFSPQQKCFLAQKFPDPAPTEQRKAC